MLSGWAHGGAAVLAPACPRSWWRACSACWAWSPVGLLLFILLTSNPFERLLPAAPDGRDLNPLLQDPGLVFHPPMLYMGYVGFSVAFAFAIAALLAGQLDAAWARWSRPWTTAAWIFLTLGIALGSWWAYYELGWGGWWFWDPVENASFMPWLVGTALIHSLAVTEKRGSFKNWTVLLAIAAFSLSLLGTFLVRSGVLTSVHAFATDPRRGIFILLLLAVVIGSSLTLFAWLRAPRNGQGRRRTGFRADLARNPAAGEQRAAGGGLRQRAAGHALPADDRRAQPRQALGRPALLQCRVRADHGAAAVPDRGRPDRALEACRSARIARSLADRLRGRGDRRHRTAAADGRLDTDDRPGPDAGRLDRDVGRHADTRPNQDRHAAALLLGPKCPLVTDHSLSVLEAKVVDQIDLGSHTIFIGETISSEVLRDGQPMTYQYYHQTLKGKSPPNAPTFQAVK